MKVFILFLFISSVAVGQKIPKGASTVEIVSELKGKDLFQKFHSLLELENFVIDKIDNDQLKLTTEYKSTGYIQIRIFATVSGNTITIKGQGKAQAGGFAFDNEPLIYKGFPSSLSKGGFIDMDKVAKRYVKLNPGSIVSYK